MATDTNAASRNFISILKEELEREVKKTLIDELISEELAAYEEKIRPVIERKVKEVCFSKIERLIAWREGK